MIDLRRLHVLRMLDEHGTVTAAAAALHLTPSAVSQQIRLLGRDTGVDLLERVGRGVRLTPSARVLLGHADRLYADWERVLAEATAAPAGGVLRLCGFPTALAALLAPAAAALRDALAVEVTEAGNAECFALLLAGEADIAVVLPAPEAPPRDDPRFDQQPLLQDPFDLVVPAGHPLASAAEVDLSAASDEPWIGADRGDDSAIVLAACSAAGFAPRIAHGAKEWNGVVALVSHGFGVCLMPRLAPVPAHHRVVRIPLRHPAPSRAVLTCVRRGSGAQPAVARGLAALAAVGAQSPLPLVDGEHDEAVPHRHTYRAAPS
ncbi:DNA-binding transcriptional LysR family regulator [Pseudonocardia hierapolitana]|uniref:DNA-binding transcriptional LysR family regulator n=1 Tax=Pseudonocardia hierapolitana TaxID=1128676 RepID=A0A561SZ82_9PSEU|nr:LysR family transcriptional regulator [Pseudonocardia hierapolitana]TWF80184.1 DNA-binding transcriptional LysR family regulator [Pseudonocardia hierapolitana]